MKIAFIGCVQFSHAALAHLLTVPEAKIVGVVSKHASAVNADFMPLDELAAAAGAPIFHADGQPQTALAAWLRDRNADVIYCFGWSHLLSREVLTAAPLGVVGYHPAMLPHNRGRHPIIWALALGLPETGSSFFLMDEGADTGNIISQRSLPILPGDDAASLYQRVTDTALTQISEITTALATGKVQQRPQIATDGNSWRKRGRADGQIDWRMPAEGIHNLVRALTRPYVGAHCLQDGRDIKIWRTELLPGQPRNIEPGKILRSDPASGHITVKCGVDAVTLTDHEFIDLPTEGAYL